MLLNVPRVMKKITLKKHFFKDKYMHQLDTKPDIKKARALVANLSQLGICILCDTCVCKDQSCTDRQND